jgi:Fe-S-cluster containining protein
VIESPGRRNDRIDVSGMAITNPTTGASLGNDPQNLAYFRSVVPEARSLFRQGYEAARETVRVGDLASLLQLVRGLHRTIDLRGNEYVRKTAATGAPVACAAGCHFCCHQNIMVSAPAAVTIAESLRAQPVEMPDLAAYAAARDGLDLAERYAKALPCPMLDDQRCGIYDDRPETCRSYFSLSRARCERYVTVAKDDGLVILRDPHTLNPFLIAGADWALAQAGFQMVWMELTPLLAQATRPGVGERWIAQEAVFTAAENDDYLARLALIAKTFLTTVV